MNPRKTPFFCALHQLSTTYLGLVKSSEPVINGGRVVRFAARVVVGCSLFVNRSSFLCSLVLLM